MNAKYWLLGCALGFTGVTSATAIDAHDFLDTSHINVDTSTRSDTLGNGPLNSTQGSVPATDDSSAGCNPDLGDNGSGGGTSAPTSSPRSHLGWQSLLPGSIQ